MTTLSNNLLATRKITHFNRVCLFSSQCITQIVTNPNFELLQAELRKNWKQLPVSEAVTLLQFLLEFGVPIEDDLIGKLLKTIQVNFIELPMDQLKSLYESLATLNNTTPMIDAMLTALPVLLYSGSHKGAASTTHEQEKTIVGELIQKLRTCIHSDNSKTVREQLVAVADAINSQIEYISPQDALKIFHLLCASKEKFKKLQQLFEAVVDVIVANFNEYTIEDIHTSLRDYANDYRHNNELYNDRYCAAVVDRIKNTQISYDQLFDFTYHLSNMVVHL